MHIVQLAKERNARIGGADSLELSGDRSNKQVSCMNAKTEMCMCQMVAGRAKSFVCLKVGIVWMERRKGRVGGGRRAGNANAKEQMTQSTET